MGWSKINTDAAFSEENKKGATSSIIRDDKACSIRHKQSGMSVVLMFAPWRPWRARMA